MTQRKKRVSRSKTANYAETKSESPVAHDPVREYRDLFASVVPSLDDRQAFAFITQMDDIKSLGRSFAISHSDARADVAAAIASLRRLARGADYQALLALAPREYLDEINKREAAADSIAMQRSMASGTLDESAFTQAYVAAVNDPQRDIGEIARFLLELTLWREDGRLDAVLELLELEMGKQISLRPDKRNINWPAVEAINGLRKLWVRWTGKKAPLNYKEGSPFAEFLQAGFRYLEVNGNVAAAFASWRKLRDAAIKADKRQ